MHRRLRLARRELASLRSEKTIVLALVIQLFVAAFSSFLVVGFVALYDPGATEGGYTVDIAVSGNATEELLIVANDGQSRRAVPFDGDQAALDAFRSGRVDAIIHAEYEPSGRIAVEAVPPEGNFRTTLVVVELKEILTQLERERRAELAHRLERQPVPVPNDPDGNPYFGFTYTILIPILAFLPAFISGSIAADSLAEELERGTFELLRVAPLSLSAIVDGKAIALIGLAPAQAALWFGFLELNGTSVAHPLSILLLVTALATLLVVLGAGLAIAIQVRRDAQLLYSLGALGVFATALLLPENPPNLVAKLAIGSATPASHLSVFVLLLTAVGAYLAVRWIVSTKTSFA